MDKLVKYASNLRKVADYEAAETRIRGFLEGLGETDKWRFEAGSALRLRASVDVWLAGPVSKGTL